MKFGFPLAMLLMALSLAARAEVLGTIETEQDDGSRSVIEILDEPQRIGKCDGAYAAAAYVMDRDFSLLAGKGCWKLLGSAEMLKLEIVLAATEEHLLSGVPLAKIKFAEDGRSKLQNLVGQ
ncbi:hypothetical protein HGG72_06720 [Ochrobactrum pecoris]|uniref:Uncharacterized protein n=1 Tax=Brucella pecoris TaxID=867683 RepID=A0A5C5CFD2_9HYPH|nr:hypothetical protein [Brucella pecoris]MBB4094320.1 hypothetical protein [Brucella pecoris]NKW80080.1 hypothetical protein [Brucella pecoris]TNV10047.1 hypothetical protein FIB18_19190 [Brucella pecoris]